MRIELSPKARRQFIKFKRDLKMLRRLTRALDKIVENPYDGKALEQPLTNVYSYRIGDYRILYELYEDQALILVIKIAHRKDVYR